MKHVGLNVAADPFFTAAYTGVTGGAVILVADDNGNVMRFSCAMWSFFAIAGIAPYFWTFFS